MSVDVRDYTGSDLRWDSRRSSCTDGKNIPFAGQVLDDSGETVTPNSLISLLTSVPLRSKPRMHFFRQGNEEKRCYNVTDACHSNRSGKSVEATVMEHLYNARSGFRERSESGTNTAEFHNEDQEQRALLADRDGRISTREAQLFLCESDTFWIMNIDSRCVSGEYPESERVDAVKDKYSSLMKSGAGSETAVEDGMQTVNNIVKTKEAQTSPCVYTAHFCQANAWGIFDAERSTKLDVREKLENEKHGWRQGKEHTKSSQAKLENLSIAASATEKAILQNVYHDKILMYRNYQTRTKQTFQVRPYFDLLPQYAT